MRFPPFDVLRWVVVPLLLGYVLDATAHRAAGFIGGVALGLLLADVTRDRGHRDE